uniref:Uncharacterized protein n=1 Tax=Plectus sambesii TaxID=2011161 RepID=A0A914X6D4_9BILA
MKVLYAFAAAFLALTHAASWDSLKVTWNINPFSGNSFADLPRDIKKDAMGFVLMDNQCNGNQPKGPFAGIRYWKDNDPAVVLIFDINGIIAGIQTVVPKTNWALPPSTWLGSVITDDGKNFVLTAYFVDPKIICSSGRTPLDLLSQGTGTGLYIQNGSNPLTDLMIAAHDESQTQQHTQWIFGHCFYTMGDHYWYNVRSDMPCNEFFPAFLLYNKKQLNAFGWALNADLSSPRYEHPPHSLIGQFMNPVPQCFQTDSTFLRQSTMHIYFSSEISDLC